MKHIFNIFTICEFEKYWQNSNQFLKQIYMMEIGIKYFKNKHKLYAFLCQLIIDFILCRVAMLIKKIN